ncbi:hypothetical protein [Litorilituus lipolyticus]|uniref:Uncharacterized protein n=1 Tax=Litorilituus lipolyticus TaxID=2491017 RepID=A0A502LAE7_9GAMM|nr:hypothetical protein [Litorilituus lipolyticus]TPH19231.1 hypothetical protein EPA86_00445 [Litorilituus lipolyticus]
MSTIKLFGYLVFGLIVTTTSLAQEKNRSNNKKTAFKCYVEYSAGHGYDIRYVIGQFSRSKQAEHSLSKYRNVDNTKSIYRIHECVAEDQKFISAKANSLDKALPR